MLGLCRLGGLGLDRGRCPIRLRVCCSAVVVVDDDGGVMVEWDRGCQGN